MDARQSLSLGDDPTRCAERLVAEGNGPGATFSSPVSADDGSAGAAAIDGGSGAFSYTVSQERARSSALKLGIWPPDLIVPAADIVGAQFESAASFRVWFCPLKDPKSAKRMRTLRKSNTFRCRSITEARAFVMAIRSRTTSTSENRARALQIILNPASGPGTAKKQYEQMVRPVLEAAGVEHTLHVTHAAGHATELAAAADLSGCDGLLFMGGDGTVHEGLQGILGRPDWYQAAAVPIALLPAGSGNALAANTGMWDMATALHAVIKGQTARMDLFSVIQPDRPRRFAFLSITFGLIANLSIGTEHLRFLGGARFTLGALQQILGQRTHQLRVAYLPAEDDAGPLGPVEASAPSTSSLYGGGGSASSVSFAAGTRGPATPLLDDLPQDTTSWSQNRLPKGWRKLEEEAPQLFAACNLPFLDMTYNLAPQAGLHTGCLDIVNTRGKSGRIQALDFMLKSRAGRHLELPIVCCTKARAIVVEPVSRATWLVVDGEVVPFTRLSAEIHPGFCTVLVAPTAD